MRNEQTGLANSFWNVVLDFFHETSFSYQQKKAKILRSVKTEWESPEQVRYNKLVSHFCPISIFSA